MWTSIATAAADCARGKPLSGPDVLGSVLVIAVGLFVMAALGHRARLATPEVLAYLGAYALLSAPGIKLVGGLWLIAHHCAA